MLRYAALAATATALVAPAVPVSRNVAVRAEVSSVERSPAMPFLPRPQKLTGMVGDKGFDPLGLSDWVPVDWLRESELKHGRVCMLAVVGFVATDCGLRLPGEMHNVASIDAHDMAVDLGGRVETVVLLVHHLGDLVEVAHKLLERHFGDAL